jgi:maltose alpha-D-glucosyltransferase/alpha-amylase
MDKAFDWLKDAVFYEIYPQSFYDTNGDGIGDLNGIIEKLDYIKWLGCNAIWINPFYDSPFGDAGYDVTNHKKVAKRYGTNEDFINLCKKAHDMGIKIICDLIPCHTSIEHEYFKLSSKKEKNDYSDFYIWCNDNESDYPHLNKRAYERDDRYLCSFYAIQPAINYGFYNVTEPWQMSMDSEICKNNKKKLIEVMDFWFGLGCDGFRVDMAKDVIKSDPKTEGARKFWREIREYMDNKYPGKILISEWSRPLESIPAGFHMDMFLSGGSLFRKEIPEENFYSYFRKEGKGVLSRFSEEYVNILNKTKGTGYWSFVSGNHDQPRISKGRSVEEIKTVMAFIMTMPSPPIIYYGDEIGMRFIEGIDKEGSQVSRGGSRTPMQWNEGKNKGFSPSDTPYLPVDNSEGSPCVSSQRGKEGSLLEYTKILIDIRHNHKALNADAGFKFIDEKMNYPLWYERKKDNETIRVIINPTEKKMTVSEKEKIQGIILNTNTALEGNSIILNGFSVLIYNV